MLGKKSEEPQTDQNRVPKAGTEITRPKVFRMKKYLSFFLPLMFVMTVPAFGAVSVSSPGNGADVTTPFTLTADASDCSNQTVSSMGYSLDSSSDTTIVKGTSIDAKVPSSTGKHTLHVKAWGSQGASCVTDVAIDVTGAAATSDGVTVSSPGNGSTVTSPFEVSATSETCDGQAVSGMGYSLDSSSNTTIEHGTTSLVEQISASAGQHTIHVKSWGNQGAGCVANIGVDVSGVGASPDSAGSSTSTDGITVASPGNGATVGSPFALSAQASSCSGQAVSGMGYSLDSSSSTTIVHNSTTVAASISASAGKHTLHVKSWGNEGAGCVANVAINVSSAAAAAATVSSGEGISVSSPSNGATVSSSFDVVASASTCSGQAVTGMGYSFDNSSDTITESGKALDAPASTSSGTHTLHVKSWGVNGAGCVASLTINVGAGSSSSTSGPSIPSSAVSVSSIQALGNWQMAYDTGTNGSASGNMALVGSPTINGSTRRFITKYTSGGGERYWVSFGDDTGATNFEYDAWVYFDGTQGDVANLEMDMNQTMSNGQTVIYGFQCDGYNNVWDYDRNGGTPTNYKDEWVQSKVPCEIRSWSRDTWHHIQITYSRSGGNVTYHSVWLDGKEHAINATVPSAFALGWGPVLLTNFQVDGLGSSGTANLYLDKLTISRW